MYFFIDDKFYEPYNNIQSKARESIKRELESEPSYNNQFLKTKMKSGKYSTNFRGKDATEVGLNYIYIPIMLIGSVLEKDGKY